MTQSTTLKDTKATVHTTFHTGQWHFPAEKMGQKEDTDNYIVITGILETPKHLFFISLQDYTTRENPSTVFTTKKNILLI